MQTFSLKEWQQTMMAAAEASADYYRNDPEVLEWLAFAGPDLDGAEESSKTCPLPSHRPDTRRTR